MAPRFYSKEWVDTCVEKANNDKEYLKKTKGYTASYIFHIIDCPDGNDIRVLLTFDDGKVVHYEYDIEPAPASFRMDNTTWDETVSLIRAEASYDTYIKLRKKELQPMQALMKKLYKTEGNMVRAIALTRFSTAFTDLQDTVDCEF